MTTDAERMKNLPGVVGNSGFLDGKVDGGFGSGAGDPDNRTLLTDLLKALAIGVDNTAENEVNFDNVFFLLDSPLVTVLFKSKLKFSIIE